MTEAWVRALAERYGLDVLKRVTTGSNTTGFATFELTGPADRVRAAWPAVHDKSVEEGRGPSFDYMRSSDAGNGLYIGIESVWFSAA